jgi:YrhK-like protein
MPEGRPSGFTREADEALEALRRHYFGIHLGAQFACSLLFVAGSALMLVDGTKALAPLVFLVGSLVFATLPAIRLLHEKEHRTIRGRREDGAGR